MASSALPTSCCQPHLDRAGRSVPATHFVAGEALCSRCFRGIPISRLETRLDLATRRPFRVQAPRPVLRPSKAELRRRAVAGVARIFQVSVGEWIETPDLARALAEAEAWPWTLTPTRLGRLLSEFGIRPIRFKRLCIGGPLRVQAYRRDSFVGMLPS